MSTQAKEINDIFVLVSRIEENQVVLPDVSIAEIVDFQATTPDMADAPDWYLGKLVWRNLNIPLVSLERMNNDIPFSQGRSLKIIVIHSAKHRKKMEYWAFVAKETPRMIKINRNELNEIKDVELGNVETSRAELAGNQLIVPNIQAIESNIAKLL